jgi:hypothetical protein
MPKRSRTNRFTRKKKRGGKKPKKTPTKKKEKVATPPRIYKNRPRIFENPLYKSSTSHRHIKVGVGSKEKLYYPADKWYETAEYQPAPHSGNTPIITYAGVIHNPADPNKPPSGPLKLSPENLAMFNLKNDTFPKRIPTPSPKYNVKGPHHTYEKVDLQSSTPVVNLRRKSRHSKKRRGIIDPFLEDVNLDDLHGKEPKLKLLRPNPGISLG